MTIALLHKDKTLNMKQFVFNNYIQLYNMHIKIYLLL